MLNPRLCLKNGRVDWSASPNATDFTLNDEKPFEGRILTPGALREIVHEHFMWVQSEEKSGKKADLRGVVIEGDAERLLTAKLADPNAKSLWAEVLASSEDPTNLQRMKKIRHG